MSDIDIANALLHLNRDETSSDNSKVPSKELKNAVLNLVLVELRSLGSNTDESKYGQITKLIKKWKIEYPWLNRNIFNYYIKAQQHPTSVTISSNPTAVSREEGEIWCI